MKIKTGGSTYCVHGWEELTSLKCPHYSKQSIDSMHSYQDPNDTFHRTRTNVSKMYMEPQKAPHSNSDPERQRSWRNHAT